MTAARSAVIGFDGASRNMETGETLTMPQSPRQNPYSERPNGSIRREVRQWRSHSNNCSESSWAPFRASWLSVGSQRSMAGKV